MQEIFNALPDPLKAASIVVFIYLYTTIGLPLGLALWQFILDRVHPPTGKKFRAAVDSCFLKDNPN